MITPPQFLITLVQPWASFFSHSKVAPTVVTFIHLAGLLLAGGLAVASDRATLRMDPSDLAGQRHQVTELGAIHRTVLAGLALIAFSGLMLLAADLETFFGSWVYWTKMGFVVLLLANGYRMTRSEQAFRTAKPTETGPAWATLRQAAKVSVVLWFTIALLGVVLVNLS